MIAIYSQKMYLTPSNVSGASRTWITAIPASGTFPPTMMDVDVGPEGNLYMIAADGPVFSSGHDLRELQDRRNDPDGGASAWRSTFDACAAGDPEGAAEAMRAHLLKTERLAVEQLVTVAAP